MDIIGVEIDLFVLADENKVRVSFAAIGVSSIDFMALSPEDKDKIIKRYVDHMEDRPGWIINDFCYIQKPTA